MKWIGPIIGAILILLGGIWLLQGTGLVVVEPIACLAECETLEGLALVWALAGAAALIAGLARSSGLASRRLLRSPHMNIPFISVHPSFMHSPLHSGTCE